MTDTPRNSQFRSVAAVFQNAAPTSEAGRELINLTDRLRSIQIPEGMTQPPLNSSYASLLKAHPTLAGLPSDALEALCCGRCMGSGQAQGSNGDTYACTRCVVGLICPYCRGASWTVDRSRPVEEARPVVRCGCTAEGGGVNPTWRANLIMAYIKDCYARLAAPQAA
jgi:hypothetical protein